MVGVILQSMTGHQTVRKFTKVSTPNVAKLQRGRSEIVFRSSWEALGKSYCNFGYQANIKYCPVLGFLGTFLPKPGTLVNRDTAKVCRGLDAASWQ